MCLPASAAEVVGPQCLELMCAALPDGGDGHFSPESETAIDEQLQGKQAVVIGPGIGTGTGARYLLGQVLTRCAEHQVPLVVDADALTILAADKDMQSPLGHHVVLTPHPGEMARLMDMSSTEVQADRLAVARKCAQQWGCWVVLKGARTVLAGPDGQESVNPAACAALATAGSGDLLAGVIGALAAAGLPLPLASQCGVFLHGAAGELAEHFVGGVVGSAAGDLLPHLSALLNALPTLAPEAPSEIKRVLPGSLHSVWNILAS